MSTNCNATMVIVDDVLRGFGVVGIVIAVGFVVGRTRVLGKDALGTLNSLVFLVALPCLLLTKITHTDAVELFNGRFAVIAMSALVTGTLVAAMERLLFNKSRQEAVVAGLAGSYGNAANLGIPLAAFVLNDATVVVPMILFQVGFYGPVSLAALDIFTHAPTGPTSPTGKTVVAPVLRAFKGPATNPVVLAAIVGIVCSVRGIVLPGVIERPIELIGGASIPVALIVFGMSLAQLPLFPNGGSARVEVAVSAVAKNIVHPLIAGLIAAFVFHMGGQDLLTSVVIAALPTAQNVFVYATRYNVNGQLARDTAVVTTLAAFPVMVVLPLIVP